MLLGMDALRSSAMPHRVPDAPVRLLIVEDDPDDAFLVRDLLDEVPLPVRVDHVRSWDEARAAVAAGAHDVFLVDYHIPGGDGVEFVRWATAAGCDAPIILLTGVGTGEVDAAAIAAGAADYLPKGELSPSTLDRAIRHALERRAVLGDLRRELAFTEILTDCSHALLRNVDADLSVLLERFRSLVSAEVALLDRVDGSDGSLRCERLLAVTADGTDPVPLRVDWAAAGEARLRLAAGDPAELTVTEGPDGEPLRIAAIPILVGEEWAGVLGFGRRGDGPEASLPRPVVDRLLVAGRLVGAFWMRERREARLRELVAARDRFIASIAHELRTPLTVVLGLAEELAAGSQRLDSDEIRGLLRLIDEQTLELAAIVENLLAAARLDGDGLRVRPRRFDLAALAAETASRLVPGARTVTGGPRWAHADPFLTRQIVRNLLTNAKRHGGSRILLDLHDRADAVVLEVRDDGPGLPDGFGERAFAPFVPGPGEAGVPASLGLGLAVARRLAESMGGDLAYRRDGDDSVFALTLPRAVARSGPDGAK